VAAAEEADCEEGGDSRYPFGGGEFDGRGVIEGHA
jgi:hypothetical protein